VPFRRSLRAARHLGHGLGSGSGLGRRHQGLEDPLVVALFGVPLHPEAELVSLQLDPLHHLVQRPGHGEQPAADPVDGLVVGGRHLRGGAENPGELAGRADLHVVSGQLDRIRLVAVVADPVGQMLDEGAAAGHVEQLHAAADGQEGQVGFDRGAGHEQLEPVPAVVGLVGLFVRRLVVERGVDVTSPGHQQRVDPGDQAGYGTGGDRWQYDRGAAGPLDGSRVAHRRHDGLANPGAPASSLKLAGDADDRAAHPSSSCT
jgi:hypothetical protein